MSRPVLGERDELVGWGRVIERGRARCELERRRALAATRPSRVVDEGPGSGFD